MSVGYALTYMVGLFGLLLVVRYLPSVFRVNLSEAANNLARERGLTNPGAKPTYRSSVAIVSAPNWHSG